MISDSADARLVVETGISPPTSPDDGHDRVGVMIVGDGDDPEDDADDPGVGDNPLKITTTTSGAVLRVKSPTDINTKKRFLDSSDLNDSPTVKKQAIHENQSLNDETSSSAAIVHKFQREMMEKYLQYQRESEVRFLAWEQERWRMEQQMIERWRSERRSHEKEMFSMFCGLLSDCSAALLDNKKQ